MARIAIALEYGKFPFVVSKGEEKRYTFASSIEQCKAKFKGWDVKQITVEEYLEGRQ